MLNLRPNFLKSGSTTLGVVIRGKCYLRQARSFDILNDFTNVLISNMLKISGPNISLEMLISFMLTKIECIEFFCSSCVMLLHCNEKDF